MPTFELIATATPASGALTAGFTSIPNTFTDLYIKSVNRSLQNASNTSWEFTLNGNTTTTNYRQWRYESQIGGTGSVATYNGVIGSYIANYINAANDSANDFSTTDMYISRYADTRQKPIIHDQLSWGIPNNRGYMHQYYDLSEITAAITSITFNAPNPSGFTTGTVFWLYGIKNA